NIKSQIKRNRQNERRRIRNKAVRSEVRTRTKNALMLAETQPGSTESIEALRLAVKKIDKAMSKGVIHPNQAANRKSGLMRQINSLASK
ncbi:MAG TPA: 30S ribosomal protein S20, partial [Acidimicrobiales bacterium]|nr:30S ribosomal protein S20 [Acidimicrobiales bacterium]